MSQFPQIDKKLIDLGMTKKDLAVKADLDYNSMTQVLCGFRPLKMDMKKKLEIALNMQLFTSNSNHE